MSGSTRMIDAWCAGRRPWWCRRLNWDCLQSFEIYVETFLKEGQMPEPGRRLTRLEQMVRALLPNQQRCPICKCRSLLAFSAEPENVGSRLPYDGPNGTCRQCRMPPPGLDLLKLPQALAAFFATLPWSAHPVHRWIEKTMLLK